MVKLTNLKHLEKNEFRSRRRCCNYIKKYKIETTLPNLEVALRIFKCIAVANCSGERSFNALKRVKNFHRSTVKVKKLNDISLLHIENDVFNEIDTNLIIDKFIESKARKRYI